MAAYDEKDYGKIEIGKLIIFTIYSVAKNGEECSFERLVKECFALFPKTFGFYRYPEWPDSLRLDRPLRTLREKGWITGSSKTIFSLTKFGEKIAHDVEKALFGKKIVRGLNRKLIKGREAKLVNDLKNNEIYQKFLQDKEQFSIQEKELRKMLHLTLETPLRIVKQGLQHCKNLAKECGENELYNFLSICEGKLELKKRY